MARSDSERARASERRRRKRRSQEKEAAYDAEYDVALSPVFHGELQPLSEAQREHVLRVQGLHAYLLILAQGRAMTPRSGVYTQNTPEQLLAVLEKHLSNELPARLGNKGSRILTFDMRQHEKFGPQGGIPRGAIANAQLAEQFATNVSPRVFTSPEWLAAIELAADKLGWRGQLLPMTASAVVARMRAEHKLNTNSGWEKFTKRSVDDVVAEAIGAANDGSWRQQPAVVLYRFYNHKLRPVWMFPFATNIQESRFTFVLENSIRTNQSPEIATFFSPWQGFTAVEQSMTMLWPQHRAVGGDIHAMDANFKQAQMEQAYLLARHCFPPALWEELHESMLNVNNIELVIGPNRKLVGPHGVASGSSWTQMCETLFQFILYCYMLVLKLKDACVGYVAIGDDSATFFDQITTKRTEFFVDLFNSVGLPANKEKQYDELNEIVFLQRLFIRDYKAWDSQFRLGGIYPLIRALKSLVYPEHRHDGWSDAEECLRIVAILENCVNHPLYVEFAKWIAYGFPPVIDFCHQSAEQLSATQEQFSGTPGVLETYNQEKKDVPLSDYRTVKLLATVHRPNKAKLDGAQTWPSGKGVPC